MLKTHRNKWYVDKLDFQFLKLEEEIWNVSKIIKKDNGEHDLEKESDFIRRIKEDSLRYKPQRVKNRVNTILSILEEWYKETDLSNVEMTNINTYKEELFKISTEHWNSYKEVCMETLHTKLVEKALAA